MRATTLRLSANALHSVLGQQNAWRTGLPSTEHAAHNHSVQARYTCTSSVPAAFFIEGDPQHSARLSLHKQLHTAQGATRTAREPYSQAPHQHLPMPLNKKHVQTKEQHARQPLEPVTSLRNHPQPLRQTAQEAANMATTAAQQRSSTLHSLLQALGLPAEATGGLVAQLW